MADDFEERVLSSLAALDSKLDRTRSGIMERIDRLQDAVSSVRTDIAVNFGQVDHFRGISDTTRDEVRSLSNLVAAMGKQIQLLQTEVRGLKGEGV